GRKAEEAVRALQRLAERAVLGIDRMGRLPLVHALGAAAIDDALGVAEDDVARRHAHGLEQLRTGDRRSARAIDYELSGLKVAPGQMGGVDESRGRDDRRSVLVVVENRDVHQLAQAAFDDE